MFIENHMTLNPQTVRPNTLVAEALGSLQHGRFHHLPVVDDAGRLVGIITDRDFRSAVGYDQHVRANLRVEEIMSTDVVTVRRDAPLEEAIRLFFEHRVGALPVVQGQQLVGIITKHDIMKAARDWLGLDRAGRRIEVAIPLGVSDIVHALSALSDDDEIYSLVAARLRTDGREPVLYIRTANSNAPIVERKLRQRGAILLAPEKPPPAL